MDDYYSLLGVPEGASREEIRRAFRARAREWHSDHLGPNATAAQRDLTEERLKAINEAKDVLSDPQRRRLYDAERGGTARSADQPADRAPTAARTSEAVSTRVRPPASGERRNSPPYPAARAREVTAGQLIGGAILVVIWYFVFAEGADGFKAWWNPVALFAVALWLIYGLRPYLRGRRALELGE
jgi:curved DNA-binding protein CbpA